MDIRLCGDWQRYILQNVYCYSGQGDGEKKHLHFKPGRFAGSSSLPMQIEPPALLAQYVEKVYGKRNYVRSSVSKDSTASAGISKENMS
jgi:hypothetical protein